MDGWKWEMEDDEDEYEEWEMRDEKKRRDGEMKKRRGRWGRQWYLWEKQSMASGYTWSPWQ